MRTRVLTAVVLVAAIAVGLCGVARGDETAERIRAMTEKASPSLVIVSFYVERDDGARADGRVLGAVVGPKNLVMVTSLVISDRVPIEQYHDFKVIVPKGDKLDTYDAEYLGKDDTAQVAFLRVKDSAAPELPPIQFDEAAKPQVGDPVVSWANLGEADSYRLVTQYGRVSGTIESPFRMHLVSQLGMQGTPVMTLEGKVVGIVGMHVLNRGTNAKPNRQPAEVIWPVERFIERVKNPPEGGQKVKRPWLGVAALNPVTNDLATYFGLGDRRGVVVGQVIADSPADKAGIKAEDIILSLNGKNIEAGEGQLVESFQNDLKEMKIGQEVTLGVFREGKEQAIKVTLAEQPESESEAKRYKSKQFGFTVREMVLMDTLKRELPNTEKGVVVSFLEPSGWAQDGGLQMEDIVKKVQDRDVNNVDEFKKVFEEEIAKKPKEVVLFVLRGKKETKLIRIEPRWDQAASSDTSGSSESAEK